MSAVSGSPSQVPPATTTIARWWVGLCGAAMLGLFGLVGWRLHDLQIREYDRHTENVLARLHGETAFTPRRGAIEDRRGRPLALSLELRSCAVDPHRIRQTPGADLETVAAALADVLELTPVEIQRFRERAEIPSIRVEQPDGTVRARPNQFVWVRRKLSETHLRRLEEAMDNCRRQGQAARLRAAQLRRREVQPATPPEEKAALKAERETLTAEAAAHEARFAGVTLIPEEHRHYPQGTLAGQLIGLTEPGHAGLRGLEGLERHLDPFLAGLPAARPTFRDARNVKLAATADAPPAETVGQTVRLALDAAVQAICEEELAAVLGNLAAASPEMVASALVVDPFTGDILAMANYPPCDPNRTGGQTGNRLNAAMATVQEPGSIMKPFTFAAALEEGRIDPDELVDCSPYAVRRGGRVIRTIRDIRSFTRPMPARMILHRSSNPGIVQVGERVGKKNLHRHLESFGFGRRTFGDELKWELRGRLRPLADWDEYTLSSVPMGYEIMVTPLQMALAYCAFANGGFLPVPRLVASIDDPDGAPAIAVEPRMRRRVLTPRTADAMRRILREVVAEGTGKKADIPEYALAGKTGTAELPVNEKEKAAGLKGYSKTRHTANFVAFAPFDAPRAVVSVTIRETPRFGGELSAPVASRIMRRTLEYLGVPPRGAAHPPTPSTVG